MQPMHQWMIGMFLLDKTYTLSSTHWDNKNLLDKALALS